MNDLPSLEHLELLSEVEIRELAARYESAYLKCIEELNLRYGLWIPEREDFLKNLAEPLDKEEPKG